jgi:hypothetical protein
MPHHISVPPADLLIDEENPRLPQPNVGQREAIRGIAKDQNRKLLVLAKDILENGLNPGDLPYVMLRGDERNRYVVLEGNRRMVALKALENPEPLLGAVDMNVLPELRRLSKQYQEAPIESVLCVAFKSREEARHWIELRHTGENEGAGVVPWRSDEGSRFRARSGKAELHLLALNFLEDRGLLNPDERRKIPATTYRRLLETPAVRQNCGVEMQDNQLRLLGDATACAKALLYVANTLVGPNAIKVKQLYTVDQRNAYAASMPAETIVKPATSGKSSSSTQAKPKRQPKRKRPRVREYLIPSDCILSVNDPRIAEIEEELRSLKLSDYENAISVLFRVFLELSADVYVTQKKLTTSPDAPLGKKLLDVATDLENKQKLTKQQVVPVRRACQKDSFIAPSITLMHKYVHCPYIFPTAGDLRANWNSLQPFVAALWAP